MKVLVTSTEGAGHLGPLLPFVIALLARGDEVVMLVPPPAVDRARATGAEVWTTPLPPASELSALWDRFRTAPPGEAAVIANREIFGRLLTSAALPRTEQIVREWQPDAVLHEPAEFAGPIAAERHAVRHLQIAISLAEVEAGSLELATPVLEPHRTAVVRAILRSPYLTKFPPAFDPSSYPNTIRYREAAADRPPDGRPLPPGPGMAGVGSPLVYVTFGTVARTIPGSDRLYRAVLRSLDGLEARVLLTTGPGPAPDLGLLPPNVQVESWVDQAEVLAQASAIVCHGGSGTVLGALAAGVPIVIAALFADQPANARRVVAAGAGLALDRSSRSATDRMTLDDGAMAGIRSAVEAVLKQPGFRQAAQAIGAQMRTAPDVDALLSTVLPA